MATPVSEENEQSQCVDEEEEKIEGKCPLVSRGNISNTSDR